MVKAHWLWTQIFWGLATSFTFRWDHNKQSFSLCILNKTLGIALEENLAQGFWWQQHNVRALKAQTGLDATCTLLWDNGFLFMNLLYGGTSLSLSLFNFSRCFDNICFRPVMTQWGMWGRNYCFKLTDEVTCLKLGWITQGRAIDHLGATPYFLEPNLYTSWRFNWKCKTVSVAKESSPWDILAPWPCCLATVSALRLLCMYPAPSQAGQTAHVQHRLPEKVLYVGQEGASVSSMPTGLAAKLGQINATWDCSIVLPLE